VSAQRRVYLHIGLPKTGTTYLQDVLWGNKEVLAQRGVLLPGRHRRRHLLASLDVREDPKLARRSGDVAHPWQDLVDEVLAWQGPAAVISHEFFGAASEEQVRRARDSFPDHELHVIVTARDMVSLGLSRWQEWVKNGSTGTVDDYPSTDDYDPHDEWGWGAFDLASILTRWGAEVAHERIHVLPVPVGRAEPHELWERFAGVIGVDPSGLQAPEEPANRSLGLVELELLRRVNARLDGFTSAGDRGRWIRSYLATDRVLPLSDERFRAGAEKVAELSERGRDAVAQLRDQGYAVVGDLGALEPREPGPERHPTEVADAELLDAACQAVAHLMTEVRSLTRERNALTKALQKAPEPPKPRVTVSRLVERFWKG
jgi:hypothetical protein